MEELANLNPCIKFIIDNYDVLCIAHPNKTVLVVGSQVIRVFPSMTDAMIYTRKVDMKDIPYAIKDCNGSDVWNQLTYSVACQHPN